jgi:hypothetical protein
MGLRAKGLGRRGRRSFRARVLDRERVAAVLDGLAHIGQVLTTRNRPKRWSLAWRDRLIVLGLGIFGLLLVGLALASIIAVVGAVATGEAWGLTMNNIKDRCDQTGFACTIASSIFFTVAPLVVASGLFLYSRFRRAKRPLVKDAKERTTQFVETAGDIVGTVVGRDDLCDIVQADLRDRKRRRPHVIVGGVGAGKTAVIVQLTQRLGRSGAVPVPVRLRDVEAEVDILGLAKRRFLRDVEASDVSAADAERIWQRLRKHDRIVVLADGLEEALADNPDDGQERDHRIRVAVSQAHRQAYPLVIASRPHDALIGLDAAFVHLEPLNKDAALEYIKGGRPEVDEHRLGWLVERGVVVESPLFLQIARDLHECNRLTPQHLNTRGADRVKLRAALLRSWIEALIDGTLDGVGKAAGRQVPLAPWEREAAMEQLSALACCGLAEDKLEVTFDMYETAPPGADVQAKPEARYPELAAGVSERLASIAPSERRAPDMQLAVTMGAHLGLVEPRKDGARFPHSIMQAYLASRLIPRALVNPRYCEIAFRSLGKEFLVALVMFSRTREANTDHSADRPGETWLAWLSQRLLDESATQVRDDKRLNLLAAAIEVESMEGTSGGDNAAAAKACGKWSQFTASDDSVLAAKLDLVARLGDAAVRPLELHMTGSSESTERAATTTVAATDPAPGLFEELYDIASKESLYRVRLAAAQQIGFGGNHAYQELAARFQDNMPPGDSEEAAVRAMWRALLSADSERRLSVEAWLIPMLVDSDTSPAGLRADRAAARLDKWLDLVGKGMPLSIEAALAQGFKCAANRRPLDDRQGADRRAELVERAEEMLKKAEFWFSRLTLLQALCLWRLAGAGRKPGEPVDPRRDVEARVKHWIGWPGDREEHRFVLEAAKLVMAAIRTGRPERYIWIDESGVTTKVGSSAPQAKTDAVHKLWIPQSSGWLVLHPRAQQLVADVLILLNLAERGATGEARERRLKLINIPQLPHCLCDERDHLRPFVPPGAPASTRGCKTGCPVGLCPYPSKRDQPYRVELSEAFCRNQRELVGRWGRPSPGSAPWQDASGAELRQFWTAMEERARV